MESQKEWPSDSSDSESDPIEALETVADTVAHCLSRVPTNKELEAKEAVTEKRLVQMQTSWEKCMRKQLADIHTGMQDMQQYCADAFAKTRSDIENVRVTVPVEVAASVRDMLKEGLEKVSQQSGPLAGNLHG